MICGNTSIQLGARNIPVTVEETHAVAEKKQLQQLMQPYATFVD